MHRLIAEMRIFYWTALALTAIVCIVTISFFFLFCSYKTSTMDRVKLFTVVTLFAMCSMSISTLMPVVVADDVVFVAGPLFGSLFDSTNVAGPIYGHLFCGFTVTMVAVSLTLVHAKIILKIAPLSPLRHLVTFPQALVWNCPWLALAISVGPVGANHITAAPCSSTANLSLADCYSVVRSSPWSWTDFCLLASFFYAIVYTLGCALCCYLTFRKLNAAVASKPGVKQTKKSIAKELYRLRPIWCCLASLFVAVVVPTSLTIAAGVWAGLLSPTIGNWLVFVPASCASLSYNLGLILASRNERRLFRRTLRRVIRKVLTRDETKEQPKAHDISIPKLSFANQGPYLGPKTTTDTCPVPPIPESANSLPK